MTWLTLEGTRNGRDFFAATIELPRTPDPYEAKREAAIQTLGERYVLDRARYVTRGDYSQHESHGADVAQTFERVRERTKPTTLIIHQEAKA
ncbi:MAG TPA: hypothetical protein DCK83_02130 [Gallionellaceae bacterium]|nr:hypothetical protein [Gallionellaceae bacterium]